MSPSTATPQGGLCFSRLAEQSPLTGDEPKSLVEVSSEYTPIVLPSRRCSLDTNADDLATTLDASEARDIEIGARGESALRYREIGARSTETTHRGEGEPPQSRDLKYSTEDDQTKKSMY